MTSHEYHKMGFTDIRKGAEVFAADNRKIGEVDDVTPDYIRIGRGFLFKTEQYIPKDAVSRVEAGRVFVNTPSDRIESMHWNEPPAGRYTGAREGEMRVPVREEELEVGKRVRKAGEVEIGKEVTEEKRTTSVPRMHEEVSVERERVERPAERPVGTSETMRVPIREEEVHVEKRPTVKEELVVKKHPVVEEERVTETVRKEHPRVERHSAEGRFESATGTGLRGGERVRYDQIQKGWEVYCSDNKKIGDIEDVTRDYIHIRKGFLFTTDLYIPASAIEFAEPGRVFINIPCSKVESMPWDRPAPR
ncbi:MAG: YsnF/AvaK domain-containing protein [Chloroflexi bacterium]|nr:YsnF/AvaK domain-containing protein [Chloroflexota bacterium]